MKIELQMQSQSWWDAKISGTAMFNKPVMNAKTKKCKGNKHMHNRSMLCSEVPLPNRYCSSYPSTCMWIQESNITELHKLELWLNNVVSQKSYPKYLMCWPPVPIQMTLTINVLKHEVMPHLPVPTAVMAAYTTMDCEYDTILLVKATKTSMLLHNCMNHGTPMWGIQLDAHLAKLFIAF